MKILPTIESESIDCVITDCPYHIVSGGCTTEINATGGILNQKKDSHGNAFKGDTKHVSLCGILNDSNPATYTRQGKLFKHNDEQSMLNSNG